MRRSGAVRPITRRELWIIMAVLVVFVIAFVLAKILIPESAGERVVSHPAVVVLFWALYMIVLFRLWRKEQRLSNA